MSNAPSYPAIAQRKQAHLESQIPAEWKLPASQIPSGMLSLEDSITNAKQYQRVNVMNVPRTCGLLTGKELEITENWDIRGLLRVIAEKRYTTEDVVRAFCKRAAIAHQVTRCLSEPLFDRALQRAKDLDRHLQNSGKPIGPLHAMCNGIYGFKPSVGRFPAGGQDGGHIPGKGRVSLQAVVGPLARSVADLGAIMEEVVPRAELFGEDCIPGRWHGEFPFRLPETQARNVTIGVLRSDGIVEPLPPIAKVLDEVAQILRKTPGVEVVEIPVPAALAKCQGLAGRLMGVDGGGPMMDLLESTGEPLIPWLQGRMKRGRELTLSQLGQLQAQRSIVERELLKMWTLNSGTGRRIDAIIHPVAPHPVPEIDRYNAVGYTSSFVLLDYPAATIPVRPFRESDLESGKEMDAPVLGSWDKANRQLWNEKTVDRRVYLDSPLSIQVVTPKQHDYELFRTMEIIDRAVRVPDTEKTAAKL
ncbi:hypothetical protein APSETT445_001863 [Aspergillus pseudonomiae]